ncbi:MAG: DNA alkylation repair protein [Planctomycetes bacterium]|nr:DNA alkylation repair protein [Planctomycetota bacterium]
MQLRDVMAALEKLGNAQTKKTWLTHGATGDLFGVKVGDMKTLMKKLPKEPEERQKLALGLYETGNLDAMYVAGLLADGARMSRKDLDQWAAAARWSMISEYTVPWVAAENPHAPEIARAWIDSKKAHVACAGWSTWSGVVSMQPDEQLDLKELERLLVRVEKEIGSAPHRVRYCMNCFVIALGAGVRPLLAKAKATAKKLGQVEVDVGETACTVPIALAMIEKIEAMGRVGKKRKTMKC